MGAAAIALLGALLSPQDLAVQTGGTAIWAGPAFDAAHLSQVVTGVGVTALSIQTLTSQVSNVFISMPANGTVNIRTGDIAYDSQASSGFSGIQTINANTGFGSSSQAATSVAVSGGFSIGPKSP